MFVDYYSILEINVDATEEEIRAAYKKQALKWHPDRNPGVDTTMRMQLINEANLILKDSEARERYNAEYRRYKEYQQQNYQHQSRQSEDQQKQTNSSEQKEQHQESEKGGAFRKEKKYTGFYNEVFEDESYEVFDETLNKWMSNAKKQAVSLAKQTIDDIIGMSKVSGKAMADQALKGIGSFIIFSVIMFIVFRACR